MRRAPGQPSGPEKPEISGLGRQINAQRADPNAIIDWLVHEGPQTGQ